MYEFIVLIPYPNETYLLSTIFTDTEVKEFNLLVHNIIL